SQGSLIRRLDELLEITCGKTGHVHDRNPTEAAAISGGLHTGNIGQLDKAVGCDARTEAPSLRLTCLEICELPPADRIDKKIVGGTIKRFRRLRKIATELLQLRNVHADAPFGASGAFIHASASLHWPRRGDEQARRL